MRSTARFLRTEVPTVKEEVKRLTVEMKAYEKTLEQQETHSRYYKTI